MTSKRLARSLPACHCQNLAAPLFLSQAFAAQAAAGVDASIVNILDQRVLSQLRDFLLHLEQGRVAYSHSHAGPGAGAADLVQRGGAGSDSAECAPDDIQFAAQAESLPLQRGPRPDDIAAAVIYLAQANTITGVTLPVDGGQHLSLAYAGQRGRGIALALHLPSDKTMRKSHSRIILYP